MALYNVFLLLPQSFTESGVEFEDESSVEADQVVLCTGYKVHLPMLSDELRSKIVNDTTNDIKVPHLTNVT